MIECKSCRIFHDSRLNCRIAGNQLRAGSLPEPWLSENLRPKVSTQHGTLATLALAKPEVFVCPVCEKNRKKKAEQMARYRARLVANRD